jgi:dienelactone hydrolase
MTDEATIQVERGEVIAADVGGEAELGVVVFAHGSGSSRHSPRNREVAEVLQQSGFQTVLVDLLTQNEEQTDRQTREHRFDIDLLTDRVLATIEWLRDEVPDAPLGLFGASTGAAAALRASAAKPEETNAVVSRGGRPDLAGEALTEIESPTLLIVGGNDPQVLQLNQSALAKLNEASSLEVVPGASHLFEEPGTLDQVARLAAAWFRRHLGAAI